MTVSIVELRAWARASQNTAEREGFDRVAKSIQPFIDILNSWANTDPYVGYVCIVPMANQVAIDR